MRRIFGSISGSVLVSLAALIGAAPVHAAANFHIRGGGDGHGIGLSQYGAYGYAQHGRDFRWILGHYYQRTSVGRLDSNPTVRVLLSSGGDASFTGASNAGGVRLKPSAAYSVRALANGQMSLVDSRGRQVTRFTGAPLVVGGAGPVNVAGLGPYRGSLELRPNGAGGIEIVNALDLEDYVRGVISAEMPSSWSPEALKAQAVAARTYAITTNAGGSVFDQYADTRSQMYRGVAAETAATDAAAAATRGLVVTYGGRPVTTYFFNSSGGHTENIENVWRGSAPEPWLVGVADPYDGAGADPYDRWGQDMSAAAAAARLAGLVKGIFIGVRVLRHGSSLRVISAQVVGSGGTVNVTGQTLQHRFGLLTTLATFTTISAYPGAGGAAAAAASPASPASPAADGAGAISALVPLVHQIVASAIPSVSGRVFPGAAGAAIVLQQRAGSSWRAVGAGHLAADGSYALAAPGAGTYRALYRGLAGPTVALP